MKPQGYLHWKMRDCHVGEGSTYDRKVGKLLLERPSSACLLITEVVAALGAVRAVTIPEDELLLLRNPHKFCECIGDVIEEVGRHCGIEEPEFFVLGLVPGAHHLDRVAKEALLRFR